MGWWILLRGGEKGKCCGRAQGFSSLASSGQLWLLGCGDPNIHIQDLHAFSADVFIAWSNLTSRLETISFIPSEMHFEWDQSDFMLWGLHWKPQQRVEGLHLIETQQVESETWHCFPLGDHHLNNKQMSTTPGRPMPDCGFWGYKRLQVKEKWDSQQKSSSQWVWSP